MKFKYFLCILGLVIYSQTSAAGIAVDDKVVENVGAANLDAPVPAVNIQAESTEDKVTGTGTAENAVPAAAAVVVPEGIKPPAPVEDNKSDSYVEADVPVVAAATPVENNKPVSPAAVSSGKRPCSKFPKRPLCNAKQKSESRCANVCIEGGFDKGICHIQRNSSVCVCHYNDSPQGFKVDYSAGPGSLQKYIARRRHSNRRPNPKPNQKRPSKKQKEAENLDASKSEDVPNKEGEKHFNSDGWYHPSKPSKPSGWSSGWSGGSGWDGSGSGWGGSGSGWDGWSSGGWSDNGWGSNDGWSSGWSDNGWGSNDGWSSGWSDDGWGWNDGWSSGGWSGDGWGWNDGWSSGGWSGDGWSNGWTDGSSDGGWSGWGWNDGWSNSGWSDSGWGSNDGWSSGGWSDDGWGWNDNHGWSNGGWYSGEGWGEDNNGWSGWGSPEGGWSSGTNFLDFLFPSNLHFDFDANVDTTLDIHDWWTSFTSGWGNDNSGWGSGSSGWSRSPLKCNSCDCSLDCTKWGWVSGWCTREDGCICGYPYFSGGNGNGGGWTPSAEDYPGTWDVTTDWYSDNGWAVVESKNNVSKDKEQAPEKNNA